MSGLVPVLTAVADSAREAALVAAFERGSLGVAVARRCVDLADLLAVAATGCAPVALVSADLRRLDRDAVARLAADGVTVVALVGPADPVAVQRMAALGVVGTMPADARPERVAELLKDAAARSREPAWSRPPTGPAAAPNPVAGSAAQPTDPATGRGRLIAVWGPAGAPGRTTLSVGLAAELAALGLAAAVADLDTYGGAVGQQLGLLEEVPGLAAAARAANLGVLDPPALAALLRTVALPGGVSLRVLTGVLRPQRWPEVGGPALEVVLAVMRALSPVTVLDCGFCLEADEELSFDVAAPRRNAATLTALAAADTVVVVGAADPVGLARLVRGVADLRELLPDARPLVVLNKVRASALRGEPAREAAESVRRHCGLLPVAALPYELAVLDTAVATGRTLLEAAPRSGLRHALADCARELATGLGWAPGRSRSRRRVLVGR